MITGLNRDTSFARAVCRILVSSICPLHTFLILEHSIHHLGLSNSNSNSVIRSGNLCCEFALAFAHAQDRRVWPACSNAIANSKMSCSLGF